MAQERTGRARGWAGRREWIRALAIAGAGFLIAAPAGAVFASFTPQEGHIAPGLVGDRPVIHALPLDGGAAIRVDGRLDEAIWQLAQSGTGFRAWSPERGADASEQTVFKVAFDEDALYFAVACLERDAACIAKNLSRRDQMTNSDLVSLYVDPYHDHTTGYNFRVNPLGVQEDSYVYGDGNLDSDWDAVWQAETYQDQDGWYAELRIPFSSIRYRPSSDTWGIQVYRTMSGRGEDTAWVVWDRETPGFVSRFGVLSGMSGIPAPRQLEVLPYAVYRSTDPAEIGPEEPPSFQNLGLDLKYGVTADLTLNATFQPDFGQVEADPAQLNLSPYETFFQEKRPFFIEGSRFFDLNGFNMFYSRRIGTGDENARIRYAAKLTGKTGNDITIGALVASTDITTAGQTHNFLKAGTRPAHYAIGRVGKEFNQGNQKINVMQTAVVRGADRDEWGDRASREAYTSGMDFELLFHDRSWRVSGSAVGSIIDPEPLDSDPDVQPRPRHGTGGSLSIGEYGGKLRGECWGGWETGKLELNDLGFLSAPDEISTGGWLGYRFSPEGEKRWVNQANLNLNFNQDFCYEPRTGRDLHTGEPIWSYQRGHRMTGGGNVNGWMQLRNFWEGYFGLVANPEGSQRYDTRQTVILSDGSTAAIPGGGPLIDEPWTWGGWIGVSSDSRKELVVNAQINAYDDEADNRSINVSPGLRWTQSSAISHRLSLAYNRRIDDTQHLANYENPGGGIGGVSYVYGDLLQRTFSLTLRSSLLFSRCTSLELYAQPYITTGDYRRARELMRPDSYDLRPYEADGFDVDEHDFTYTAMNINAVLRWEYRPGSTLYLVWTQSRSSYEERVDQPTEFEGRLNPDALFDNEAENVFLIKFSYWIPV